MSAVEEAEAATTTQGTTPSKARQPWFITLLVVCPALLVYGALKPSPLPDLAFAFGYNLVPALTVAAIIWLCSSGARGRKSVVLVSVITSLLVGNYLGVLREREKAHRFLDSVQSTTRAYTDQAIADPLSGPKSIEIQPAVSTHTGDTGAAEVLLKQMLNEGAAIRNAYLAELNAVGWYALLDPKRLKADPSLEQSWSTIKGAERIARKYRERSMALIEAMPEKVRQAKAQSPGVREAMARGLEDSLPKARSNAKELWDLELAALKEMRGLFEHLDRRRGHWQATDSKLLFEAQADLTAYSASIQTVTEIGRQQMQAQRRMQAEQAQTLDQTRAGL